MKISYSKESLAKYGEPDVGTRRTKERNNEGHLVIAIMDHQASIIAIINHRNHENPKQ